MPINSIFGQIKQTEMIFDVNLYANQQLKWNFIDRSTDNSKIPSVGL